MEIDAATLKQVLRFQYLELTEALIYEKLAKREKNAQNRKVLQQIADDEVRHYEFWKEYSGQEVAPSRLRVAWFSLLAWLLGITFCVNLLERDEADIATEYRNILDVIPAARPIMEEEEAHEQHLLAMLDEERLQYTGSMVLGLNDALVELTGALAGLTFAFQNLRLVALAGLVTGIAAAMSMPGTLIENVPPLPSKPMGETHPQELDLADNSVTENTRFSYPLSANPHVAEGAKGPHPKTIVLLTADAPCGDVVEPERCARRDGQRAANRLGVHLLITDD